MCGFNVLESAGQKEMDVVVGLEFGCIKLKACRDFTENMRIKSGEDLRLRSTSNKDVERMVALSHCLRQNLEEVAVDATIIAFIETINDEEKGDRLFIEERKNPDDV